uniref:Uncharacterized protein n=1 Tax=candidate division CPR3 bacterium TaxID=2268181 RepID=A0A7C4R2I0_UNCC3
MSKKKKKIYSGRPQSCQIEPGSNNCLERKEGENSFFCQNFCRAMEFLNNTKIDPKQFSDQMQLVETL